MSDLDAVIHALRVEHARSVVKYGDWQNYTVDQMVEACLGEVREVISAYGIGNVSGPHGMLPEGLQAANCFLKMLIELGRRQAEEIRRSITSVNTP